MTKLAKSAPRRIDYATRPLEGRAAIVFGAGCCGDNEWGNGEATALAYGHAGARVACVDLVQERAAETAEHIREAGGEALVLKADVSSSVDMQEVIARVAAEFGTVEIIHNNVGLSIYGDPVSMDEELWDHVFAVNVKSVFLACKYALPIMRKQRYGIITNISSILSHRVSEYDITSYYATKAAIDHMTRSLAVRNAPYGIRANVIQPGVMNTPLLYEHEHVIDLHGGIPAMIATRDAMSPTLQQGSAWDIANAAVFLASEAASYINGVILPVDGGLGNKQAAQAHTIPDDL